MLHVNKYRFSKLIILCIVLMLAFSCNKDDEERTRWQRALGGSSSDEAYSIRQTTDGGYIVAGSSLSDDGDATVNYGFFDYWIVKLTASGNISWQKSLGGSHIDHATSVQQTTEGGYIVAGYTASDDGNYDYWIVKLTASGNITWQRPFGGSDNDFANSIQQTTEGDYIIAGESSSNDGDVTGNHGKSDFWIVKLTTTGDLTWQKSFGGSDNDYASSVKQTRDGGYIVAGTTRSDDGDVTDNHGDVDYWIVKLSSTGDITWQKSFGGSDNDMTYSIQQTTDGGYIVAGYSYSNDGDVSGNHGSRDYWIVKLTASGALDWQRSMGGSDWDMASSVQQTTDGGYIIAGGSYSNDGDVTENKGEVDYWIVKLTSSGELVWEKALGGSDCDYASSIQQTTDGGYIIAGESWSDDEDITWNNGIVDYWIVKLTATGEWDYK